MPSYEEGFLDALYLVEHLALKTKDKEFIRKVTEITEELKSAVIEKRIDKLRLELGVV